MKKILAIVIVLLSVVSAFGQTGNDTTKYVWYKFTYGNRQDRYWANKVMDIPSDTTFSKYGIAKKSTTLYVGNGFWWTAAGSTTTPAGNFGNLQINRFSVFATPASDSLSYTSNIFQNLGWTAIGAPITSNARVRIGSDNRAFGIIDAGSAGTTFDGSGGDPSMPSDGGTAFYKFWGTDSSITTNTTGTRRRYGMYAKKDSYYPGRGSYPSQTFTFGHALEWTWHVSDSVRLNPQVSDGIAGVRSRVAIVKHPTYTGRSVVNAGSTFGDAATTVLGIYEFKGTSAGNNVNVTGTLSGFTSYIISDNATGDTVNNFIGFLASGGGSGVPKIRKRYDFLGGIVGNTANTDSAWAFFSIHPTAASGVGPGTVRHVFGGPVSIDTSGLHTGPSEALEIWNGSILMKDGNEGAGRIIMGDANGKMRWVDTTGLFPGSGGGGGGGGVTSVATGFGLLGGTITTTGTLKADTSFAGLATWAILKKKIDSLGALIAGGGITGTMVSTRIPVGSGASTLTTYAGLTYDGTDKIGIGSGFIRDNGSNMRFIASGGYEMFNGSNFVFDMYDGSGTNGVRITPNGRLITSISGTSTVTLNSVVVTSAGSVTIPGSLAVPYVAKTTTYTASATDHTIDCTSGTFTVNLPTAASISGRIYTIKNSGAGVITVDGNASETIDGATTYSLASQYKYVTIQSNGTNWIVTANN